MEKFSKNPSNANGYFIEVMAEFDNQRDIVRKETTEYVCDKINKKFKNWKDGEGWEVKFFSEELENFKKNILEKHTPK